MFNWMRLKWLMLMGFVVIVGACFNINESSEAGDIWRENGRGQLTSKETQELEKLNQTFVSLAEKLSPSVVNIYTKTHVSTGRGGFGSSPEEDLFRFFFGNPFGRNPFEMIPREAQSLGSGFILNEKQGYVVTNSHVVSVNGKAADEIMVQFIGQGRDKSIEAEVVGIDPATDVALIKLKGKRPNLKPVILGDSDKLKVGEWVLAIGNPYGHAHTVTQGIISALGRDLSEISMADFIQTSASINPGNSGGPLFNIHGEVIGINTAIDPRAQGIGFAIPINVAKDVIRQLVERGEVKRGWIGIGIADISPAIAKHLGIENTEGVLVQSIEKGDPADKAGIKVYDVITKVNGKDVRSARDLANAIASVEPGNKAKMTIKREGKTKNITVKVAERPSESVARGGPMPTPKDKGSTIEEAGLQLGPLTDQIKQQLGLSPGSNGVLVEGVRPASPSGEAGLRTGDVIVEINKKAASSVGAAEKLIGEAIKKKSSAMLRVLRGGFSMIVVLDFSTQ